jgi:very-short-patch-repair endonuclease
VIALQAYLAYAETGKMPELGGSTGEAANDFESDVSTFLATRGYVVDAQVGVTGFFIDVAVRHPSRTGHILGIECDGAAYHSSKSARDRDRIRQEVLEAKGWRIHRVWSTDWFQNRANAEARLLDAVVAAIQSTRGR